MSFPPLTMQFLTSTGIAGRLPLRSWKLYSCSRIGAVAGLLPEEEEEEEEEKEKEKKEHFYLQIFLRLRPLLLSGFKSTSMLDLKPSRKKCQSAPSEPVEHLQHHIKYVRRPVHPFVGCTVPKPCFNICGIGWGRPTGGTARWTSKLSRLHLGTNSEGPKHLVPVSSVAGRNISEAWFAFRKYFTGT